jgi:hypothetical protein
MVATTQNFVGDFGTWGDITDYDLLTFCHHDTSKSSCIMSGTSTTPT